MWVKDYRGEASQGRPHWPRLTLFNIALHVFATGWLFHCFLLFWVAFSSELFRTRFLSSTQPWLEQDFSQLLSLKLKVKKQTNKNPCWINIIIHFDLETHHLHSWWQKPEMSRIAGNSLCRQPKAKKNTKEPPHPSLLDYIFLFHEVKNAVQPWNQRCSLRAAWPKYYGWDIDDSHLWESYVLGEEDI